MNLKLDHKAKRRNLMATTVMAGVAALGAPAAVAVVTALAPTAALAQDYTAGTLIGHVTDSSGAAVAGAAVTVRSQATGVTQNSTTDATGTFRAPLIPTGAYSVTVRKAGFGDVVQEGLGVRAGGESNYGFTLTTGSDVDAVVVVAKRVRPQLDFSQTTTGLSVDVEQLAKQIPLGRSTQALILLAPGTLAGSAANFRGLTAINGGSVSENAYFINGLNITNFDTYLTPATVPFDFYKTFEVKTGGYPAEFGRATGGIITATTKSGTNDLYIGIHGNYNPSDLRSNQRDTYASRGRFSDQETKDISFEAGLPLLRDHLFFYGLVDLRDTFASSASKTSNTYTTQTSSQPFYGAKLDGYITSRQHLEATYFRTNDVTKLRTFSLPAASDTVGAFTSGSNSPTGGEDFVFKYTGTFTDWFTLSGAYGRNKDNFATLPLDTVNPVIQDSRPVAGLPATRTVSQQTTASIGQPYRTKRDFYRVDADFYFNLLGKHHVRAGYDHEDDTLIHFTSRIGGENYVYAVSTAAVSAATGIPVGTQYISGRVFTSGGAFDQENEAKYIQDSWEPFRGFSINYGVRLDSFQQAGAATATAAGPIFVQDTDEIGPRVGVTWDPFNDGQNKFFGNYGRYYLPFAANTAFRQVASAIDFTEYFAAPAGGFPDPVSLNANKTTGQPAIGAQFLNGRDLRACLPGGRSTVGAIGCVVRNDGTVAPPVTATSKELAASYEDEYILGYSHKFNNLWSASATLTYRNLGRASEDVSVDPAVNAFCLANGIKGCATTFSGFHQYVIINPGEDATVTLNSLLPGETTIRTLSLTAAQLQYPKVKREYTALDLSVDRAFDGKWALHASYTLSQSKGNYEGFSKSDTSNGGQVDSGISQDFDVPSLLSGAYGLLPNHRAHVFKGYGSYALTPELLFGASSTLTSPKKYACIGLDPFDTIVAAAYGNASFYCGGVLTPRGTAFETPWTFNLDISARYSVPKFTKWMPGNLVLRADVFNILNQRSTTEANEFGETASGTADPNYAKTIAYQTPRSVRFGFDLTF